METLTLNAIDTRKPEGRYLLAALSKISLNYESGKSLIDVLNQCVALADEMFDEEPEIEPQIGEIGVGDFTDYELVLELARRIDAVPVDIGPVLEALDADDLSDNLRYRVGELCETSKDELYEAIKDEVGDAVLNDLQMVRVDRLTLAQREHLRAFLEDMFPAVNEQEQIINF